MVAPLLPLGSRPLAANDEIPVIRRCELFAAWFRLGSEAKVAAACGVTVGAVRRVRVEDGWDARAAEIQRGAAARADELLVERLGKDQAQTLQLVRAAKARVAKSLQDLQVKGEGTSAKTLVADLERLVRAEALLLGKPTERVETAGTLAVRAAEPDLSVLTDAELETYRGLNAKLAGDGPPAP